MGGRGEREDLSRNVVFSYYGGDMTYSDPVLIESMLH